MGYTVINNGLRPCIMCGEVKPVDQFYSYPYTTKQGKRSVRLESRCQSCSRTRRLATYRSQPAVESERHKAWHAANRDKVLARNKTPEVRERVRPSRRASEAKRRATAGEANGAVIQRVLDEARVGDRFLDAYSGYLIDVPTIDHIVPLTRGGSHEYENLCVTSKANNSSKFDKPLVYWLATR